MAKFSRSLDPGPVSQALHALVSQVPASTERAGANGPAHAQAIAKKAALKAAAVSGTLSLPVGPLGLATVLPDLLGIWRIQSQMVADIAAVMGRRDVLTPETMIICLFKHGGVGLTRMMFASEGEDVVVQRIANRTLQQLLEKIAIRMLQRLAAKSIARWLPFVGALGAGAYAFYDTAQVAANALELFGKRGRVRLTLPETADDRPGLPQRRVATKAKRPTRRRRPKTAPE
ncbi:MAG TPA: hypothetical protein VM029_08705 [Opitutaceae bacterium]|nr:hypothetical protein [Opitutaceae bacterium]